MALVNASIPWMYCQGGGRSSLMRWGKDYARGYTRVALTVIYVPWLPDDCGQLSRS
jgi:hypothetical protein